MALTISARRAEPTTSLFVSSTMAILSSASRPCSGLATAAIAAVCRIAGKDFRVFVRKSNLVCLSVRLCLYCLKVLYRFDLLQLMLPSLPLSQ